MVFERLNSGGEKLYPQESRNAVFGGPFNDLCKELAKIECLDYLGDSRKTSCRYRFLRMMMK